MSDGFFGTGSNESVVDVAAFLDSDIPGLIAELVSVGCLVSIGSTRDRGAVSLAVTNDGERARSYFRDSSDAADWLRRGCSAVGVQLRVPASHQPPQVQRPARGRSKAV